MRDPITTEKHPKWRNLSFIRILWKTQLFCGYEWRLWNVMRHISFIASTLFSCFFFFEFLHSFFCLGVCHALPGILAFLELNLCIFDFTFHVKILVLENLHLSWVSWFTASRCKWCTFPWFQYWSPQFSKSRSPIKLNQILLISKSRCGHNMLLRVRSNPLSDVQYAKNMVEDFYWLE